ncbi:MAG TPA: peptidylprolyl isomerase, partial [Dongiaceae bacterium]|nr:peptidylprolyl isomerase [Dongiaceae bacterium]
TTTEGEMVIEFWPDVAPKTVENFKTLARKGFYDGTAFHRVIKGFMIQGGDPLTKDPAKEEKWGTGDPEYKIDAEFSKRPHTRGVISMARNGDPMERYGQPPRPQFANSAGSQFFICHATAPHLDGKYSAFGKLIKGEDVLDKIANTPVTPDRNKPLTRIEVQTIKIVPADSVK